MIPREYPGRRPSRGRSLWAVFAGILTVFVTSLGTDALMHGTGVFPPWGQPMDGGLFGLALAYRIGFGILGGWVTARLAPWKPMQHALIMGGVGVLLSLAGAAGTWNKGPEFGPKWYPLALVATALPCAWAGGRLVKERA